MLTESIQVCVADGAQLHLKRFYQDGEPLGQPVFMVHGLVEDGRIFYSPGGNGLACYLAKAGYDVYVADLRGKGKSWPATGPDAVGGMHETINTDIPALLKTIVRKRGPIPQIWVSHAWGGVVTSSYYARHGDSICPVERMVYFGSRRRVQHGGWKQRLMVDVMWKRLAAISVKFQGYLPAKSLQFGTRDESARLYHDSLRWMYDTPWIDSEDGFDYAEAMSSEHMPPSLYFACESDGAFGNPEDVRQFICELGEHNGQLIVLGARQGNLKAYGHLEMLADKSAEEDHFPLMLDWLDSAANPA